MAAQGTRTMTGLYYTTAALKGYHTQDGLSYIQKKEKEETLTAIYALAHYKKTTERQILNIYIIFKYLLHFTHTQKKHQHDNLI